MYITDHITINDMCISHINIELGPGNPIDKSRIDFKCFINESWCTISYVHVVSEFNEEEGHIALAEKKIIKVAIYVHVSLYITSPPPPPDDS